MDREGEALMADSFAKIDTTITGRKTASGWLKMRASGEIPDVPGMANLCEKANAVREKTSI
jgi:hypothetical protein